MRGGDALALKTKRRPRFGDRKANDSKPKGDQHVFTHFPKDPNCQVCRMIKTTRARCKNRPLRRADGISPPTHSENFMTVGRSTLNLEKGSRNAHRNAPHLACRDSCPRKDLHRRFKRSSAERVRTCNERTRHKHSSSLRNHRYRRKSCSLNDNWNDERKVLQTEEWIGTARVQILRIKLPAGYKRADGRPQNSELPHDMLRCGPQNVWDNQRSKSKRRLRPRTKKRPDCKKAAGKIFDVLSDDTKFLKEVEARAKLKTMRGSSNAVHCQG